MEEEERELFESELGWQDWVERRDRPTSYIDAKTLTWI
jgi:hypothetical protein